MTRVIGEGQTGGGSSRSARDRAKDSRQQAIRSHSQAVQSGGASGGNSAAAKVTAVLQDRADKYAAKAASGGSYATRIMAQTTQAAAGLAGDKARVMELVRSKETGDIAIGLSSQDVKMTPNNPGVFSAIERWVEPGTGNRPLSMTQEKWESHKERHGASVRALNERGFSNEEIAGYLMYETMLLDSIGYEYGK